MMQEESIRTAASHSMSSIKKDDDNSSVNIVEGQGNEQQDQHELYRIALYYYYIPIPDIEDMMNFHKTILNDDLLVPSSSPEKIISVPINGRVRVSFEGINGVLSGLYSDLLHYEESLREKLDAISTTTTSTSASTPTTNTTTSCRTKYELDIKYCLLRTELPVSVQLFTNLLIQKTNQVVGLVEQIPVDTSETVSVTKKKTGYSNGRRQRRKNRTIQERNVLKNCTITNNVNENDKYTHQQQQQDYHNNNHVSTIESNTTISSTKEIFRKALQHEDEIVANNCKHLLPTEWNELIEKIASTNLEADMTASANDAEATEISSKKKKSDVVLVDCRNVYESNIGYFHTPNVTTILTNTRKFSELPDVLQQQSERLSQASHIFMYCTGGVRCERASTFLHALLEEKQHEQQNYNLDGSSRSEELKDEDEASTKKELPKIYQLHGGIQRYLECDNNTMFHGKNFVFDPRRTDPIVGGSTNKTNNNSNDTNDADKTSATVVGRCLVCDIAHDDYDNGCAPLDNNDVRCYKCRILLLVCPTCREHVRCWGEQDNEDSNGTNRVDENKPKLFCGGLESNGGTCYHMPPVRELN